jgi:phage-related protein
MADFPADPLPSYPIEESVAEPEVLVSVHKDGSEQRRFKGGGKGRTFRLSFGASAPITNSQRQAILDHYAGQYGSLNAFNWTHPERTTETYLVRYAERPQFRHVGYNAYEGEVILQEVSG